MPDGSSIENNLGIKQEVSHSYHQKKINSVDVKIVGKKYLTLLVEVMMIKSE